MKTNTSNNEDTERKQILNDIQTGKLVAGRNTSNPFDRKRLEEIYKSDKSVKNCYDKALLVQTGYAKALENEIDFLEGNDECNCCHKVNYWIRLRIKSLKQEIAKLESK